MEAVKSNGSALRYAPLFQTANVSSREIVIEAVKKLGFILEYAPTFQTANASSREIVLIAVKNSGYSLEYIQEFKKEYEFYGRILDFKELRKEIWKKDGIGEGLARHFGHPSKL